jgi:NACHT domain
MVRTAIAGGVTAGAVVTLELWDAPPFWLASPRRLTVTVLHWTSGHVLRLAVASLVIAIVMPLFVGWIQYVRSQRDVAEERRRLHDREVMLKRVRYKWIHCVLDQSLSYEARIRLGMVRRPDLIERPALMIKRPEGHVGPLPAGTQISTVFEQLGGGLLILGAPGSGKTTALLELTRDLLEAAAVNELSQIPIVFNLSSWAGRRAPLADWLIEELGILYSVPRSIAVRWLASNEILLLLDGLDEVTKKYRADCVRAINVFHRKHGLARFVVCARTDDYSATAAMLQVEEAVELLPPTREQVKAYLADAGSALRDVQVAVEADETLWPLLQSPLVLNVVALTYRGRDADALRVTGSSEKRLELLWTAYVERMLEERPMTARYTPDWMRYWLAWLARSMRDRGQTGFYIDRLEPDWLRAKTQRRLATLSPRIGVGLIYGFASGLGTSLTYGLAYGLGTGLVFGLGAGLAFWLIPGLRRNRQVEQLRWSWRSFHANLVSTLIVAFFGGLVTGLLAGVVTSLIAGPHVGLHVGLIAGLAAWPSYGLFFGLAAGVRETLADERNFPNEGTHRSARHAIFVGIVFGLTTGLFFGILVRLVYGIFSGLGYGLLAGLGFGGTACIQHLAIRSFLAYNGCAPLRYVRFLDDATERLLLRRTGSGYIFVHRLLLAYFAELHTVDPRTHKRRRSSIESRS